MVVYILLSNAKTLLGLFCNSNCIHRSSHITLSFSISFGLACRGYTFDRSAFNVLFQKV